jgi:acetylornithine deacetylase/succinyl-diaminopimelate desuccinylase-like protein
VGGDHDGPLSEGDLLEALIRPDSVLVRRVRDLVAIPSVNPMGRRDIPASLLFERHAAEYAAREMRALGLAVETFEAGEARATVVGVLEASGKPRLLLDAHLDTVPVDGMDAPFDPRIVEGAIRGRGACDTKGSLAVFLTAVEEMIAERRPFAYSIVLAATADEELAATGAHALAERLQKTPLALAIFGEPTGLDVIHAHKGILRLGIEARGRSSHASNPGAGRNALYVMARILLALEELGQRLAEHADPRLGPATVNPGLVGGGISVNTVPDHCRVDVDVRLLPGWGLEAALSAIEEALMRVLPPDEWRLTAPYHVASPMCTDPEVEPARAFLECCSRHPKPGGGAATVGTAPYATNAQAFAGAGIPCLVFGPGEIELAHTPMESVPIAQLEGAVRVVKDFLTAR